MPRLKRSLDTLDVLESLARIDCSLPEMAAVLHCEPGILQRGKYGDIIKKARLEANAALRRLQWQTAFGGNVNGKWVAPSVAMQIWLGKQRLGQREPRQEVEVTDRRELPAPSLDEYVRQQDAVDALQAASTEATTATKH